MHGPFVMKSARDVVRYLPLEILATFPAEAILLEAIRRDSQPLLVCPCLDLGEQGLPGLLVAADGSGIIAEEADVFWSHSETHTVEYFEQHFERYGPVVLPILLDLARKQGLEEAAQAAEEAMATDEARRQRQRAAAAEDPLDPP